MSFTASENTTGEPRTATVTITFTGTKSNASSITITIIQEVSTVGIIESTEDVIVLSPNPTSKYLYLTPTNINRRINIYDMRGRVLLNEQIRTNKINIGDLQNGVYTIRIVSEKSAIIKTFVKQ